MVFLMVAACLCFDLIGSVVFSAVKIGSSLCLGKLSKYRILSKRVDLAEMSKYRILPKL
jgi:hypothetical protein